MTRFMVIETFHEECMEKAYERLSTKGRMLPEGLFYIESWLTSDGKLCYQLMETDDRETFSVWTKMWDDLVTFEIIELGEKPK